MNYNAAKQNYNNSNFAKEILRKEKEKIEIKLDPLLYLVEDYDEEENDLTDEEIEDIERIEKRIAVLEECLNDILLALR